jgi:hypothetical protein
MTERDWCFGQAQFDRTEGGFDVLTRLKEDGAYDESVKAVSVEVKIVDGVVILEITKRVDFVEVRVSL